MRSTSALEDIVVIVVKIEDCLDQKSFADHHELDSFSIGRRAEFIAGRFVARKALAQLGVFTDRIQVGTNRQPVWPHGVVASISHTKTHVGVAAGPSRKYSGIGFDLEKSNAVSGELVRQILTVKEQSALFGDASISMPSVVFSAKEAVYKAVNPLTDEFLEFHDVEISFSGKSFSAWCRREIKSANLIDGGAGYYEIVNGLVHSLFVIRNR